MLLLLLLLFSNCLSLLRPLFLRPYSVWRRIKEGRTCFLFLTQLPHTKFGKLFPSSCVFLFYLLKNRLSTFERTNDLFRLRQTIFRSDIMQMLLKRKEERHFHCLLFLMEKARLCTFFCHRKETRVKFSSESIFFLRTYKSDNMQMPLKRGNSFSCQKAEEKLFSSFCVLRSSFSQIISYNRRGV